jgi:hypothetical protein
VHGVTDVIVRELRLRRFTDVESATIPAHSLTDADASAPSTKQDSPTLTELSARHSRRREVDEQRL